ncbi:MAG: DUF4097 family beta strand repeat-containing protein [Clostridiaceae bacterium]|nr:DUF4097 family beta strand repeat-containing protein [Clostridiaceae bacterium]
MKKSIKVALSLIAAGLILMAIGFFSGGFKSVFIDSNGINIADIKENLVEINDNLNEFKNIDIDFNYGDIEIISGNEFSINGIYDKSKYELTYNVDGDTLILKDKSIKKINFNLSFFGSGNTDRKNKITICIPENTTLSIVKGNQNYGDIKIDSLKSTKIDLSSDFGNINLNSLSSDSVNIKADDGKISLDNSNCKAINLNSDFGDIIVNNTKTEDFNSTSQSGSLKFNDFTANKITATNESGDIKADKIYTNGLDLNLESGKVKINGELKGTNIINSDCGDIEITSSLQEDQYSLDLECDSGEILINDSKFGNRYKKDSPAENSFKIKDESSKIKLNLGA